MKMWRVRIALQSLDGEPHTAERLGKANLPLTWESSD